MGLIGTDIINYAAPEFAAKHAALLTLIDVFFVFYGIYLTVLTARGVFRCTFPASDIFLVGVCQTAGSAYIFCALISCYLVPLLNAHDHPFYQLEQISVMARWAVLLGVGLLGNMPLLWTYPRLVIWGYSRPFINCYLHFTLFCAWGSQGYALWQMLMLMNA